MTTVILVIIGILIAGAAAIFMIFYGGSAYDGSGDRADAARLVGEGVQIEAAVQAFRAQEDRMPGGGTGVDAKAMKELVCKDYLTHVPQGLNTEQQPQFDCASSADPTTTASPWKVDYGYGIARSVVGSAYEASGKESRAMAICRAARTQLKLPGNPQRCDAAGISTKEPCCLMSADDAAL